MQIMTLSDLAEMFRVNPATIRRAVKRNRFPRPLPGFHRPRWSAATIEEWMRGQPTAAPDAAAPARRGRGRPRVED